LLLKKPKKNKEAGVSLFFISGFSLADKSVRFGRMFCFGNIGNTLPLALHGYAELSNEVIVDNILIVIELIDIRHKYRWQIYVIFLTLVL
jgi:hypothetical protein